MFGKMLFLAAMCKHVPGIKEEFKNGGRGGNRKEIVLARHHFPIVVYEFLGHQKVTTTLLREYQLIGLSEKDMYGARLLEECNRVEKLSSYLKSKILSSGSTLLVDFTAREAECIEVKKKLFFCLPVATRTEITDTINELTRPIKVRLPLVKEPLLPDLPSYTEDSELLLPVAQVSISKISALLQAAGSVPVEKSP